MGWAALIGQGVDVASLHCGHGEMLYAEHSRALAALLSERLANTAEPGCEHRTVQAVAAF
jgi:hypothetical protein